MWGYGDDLAYVHDAGFSDCSLNAAPGLLRVLRRNGITSGLGISPVPVCGATVACGWQAELHCAFCPPRQLALAGAPECREAGPLR